MITIAQSVGRNGKNLPADVVAIGAALVAVGPARGGLLAPPLSIAALGTAIDAFQRFQKRKVIDGRVDPAGGTLRRINEILFPGASPQPTPTPGTTGAVRPMTNTAGQPTVVDDVTWSPIEASLGSDFVFKWGGFAGKGKISYFELDEKVIPRWFGVLVPDGLSRFDRAHLFFHPTPGQAGYNDGQYQTLGNWTKIFHYLTDRMGAQFCAAGTERVLVMPLMTESAAGNCGVLPQRWESIVGRILGMLRTGDLSGSAPAEEISSLVVSSFSSGITYSHQFRTRANLGTRLTGVIDFDGAISTYKNYSAMITTPPGRVVKMQQMPSTAQSITTLAAKNVFPLGRPRWGPPWDTTLSKDSRQALLQIHGTIPKTMMLVAARRAG